MKTSDGPMGVGTTWHGVSKVISRRFESDIEFEPDRKIVFTVTKAFAMTATVTLEPVSGGTRVIQTIQAEPGGFFKLAEPLAVTMSKRQLQNDLDNLRDLMDANAL